MFLLYHVYVYLEFLILACTIYILAPTMTIITVILLKFLIILHLTLHISSDNVLTLFVVSVC